VKLVLDTNVVMELLHWQDPRSNALMGTIDSRHVCCFTDAGCLAELQRVLAYPQFGRDEASQQALLDRYRAFTADTPPGPIPATLPRCRDGDDQKFMELAARCDADLLVTRDRELLKLARSRRHPAPFAIVTPEQAIARLLLTAQESNA
jgi:putative PIN family toxin of toxin-antitoxin system